jgi:glutathione S-transferase
MKLYDFELSADCYKVRLLLAILGLSYEVVPIDVFPGREHERDWFLKLSPEGELPVLEDGGMVVTGATSALIYLAEKFEAGGRWLAMPPNPAHAEATALLAIAARLAASAGRARLAVNFGYDFELAALQREARKLLREIDEHLWFGEREGRHWLCTGDHPTIADIACFPDIVLCEEGGVSRQDFPAVRRWLDRVKRVPGFVTMSGVFPAAGLG